jgi:transmembrane protein TMEM260 (protein O-mannosyltransferase)
MMEWIQSKLPLIILFISLGFYIYTLAPVVTFVDSGELAAVIATRGVAHPPGFPLYLLLASVAAIIPIGSLIWRLNAFSGLCAAISVALTFTIFNRIAATPPEIARKKKTKGQPQPISIPAIDISWAGASVAAFAWMTNKALWYTATVTEVYALHAMLITLFCFFLVSYSRAEDPASTRYLALACLVAGLGISNYPPFGLLAPGTLFYVYRFEKRSGRRFWGNKHWMILLILAGLLPYVLLPIRANSDPLLNWGNPSNWELFWKHISAAQYKIYLGSPNFALLSNAFSLWWDQWPIPVWLLILPGIVFLWKFRRNEFYLFLIIGAMNILYVLSYDITDVSSAPSDYYAYLLPLCWVSAMCIGSAGQWIVLILQRLFPRSATVAAVILIAAVPIVTATIFWKSCNRHNYSYADDFARSILVALPPNALVLAPDWTFVSPALYLQHVENVRPDVVVLDTELLRRSWYFPYLTKRAPWLAQSSHEEIMSFTKELRNYEEGKPYDSDRITEKYVDMLNNFIAEGLTQNHPPHILLNLEQKEFDPQNYRNWEKMLKRPPFITMGVTPSAIGGRFQWVPENLAFRLYGDHEIHSLPSIEIPAWPFDSSHQYDPVTQGVIARYAEFWRWRGDYLRSHGNCTEAFKSCQKADKIIPYLPEVYEGLSVCIEQLGN